MYFTTQQAANKIYNELMKISLNRPLPNFDSPTYIYIDKSKLEHNLDTVTQLINTCTNTSDTEFNKLATKLLRVAGTFLFDYFRRDTPYLDHLTYHQKFWLDMDSIKNVGEFFYSKYVSGRDCYLVLIETDLSDMLQIPVQELSDCPPEDKWAVLPICLFNRGDTIKIKQFTDENYTRFNYNPSQLISTIKFSVVNNQISGTVDNSKWTDAAWNL